MTKKKSKRMRAPPPPGELGSHPVHMMARLVEAGVILTAQESLAYDREVQLLNRLMRAAKAGGASAADIRSLVARLPAPFFDSLSRRLQTVNATGKSARKRRGIQDEDYDRAAPHAKSDKGLAATLNRHPTTLARYKKRRFG